MPIISVFFGIVVRMFYKEHEPPHFHADHQGQQAKFDFAGKPIAGQLQSRTALRLIRDWAGTQPDSPREELDGDEAGSSTRKDSSAGVMSMPFLPLVVRAKHCGAFRIHLIFNDNVEATIDFGRWLEGPVFEPLKEPRYFARFFIDGGTVVWPNGADIAPETLYDAAVAEASGKQLRAAAVSEARAVYKPRQKRRRD